MSCDHPRESMKWVREGPLVGVCRCGSCGEEFEVKGWAVRGAADSARDGFNEGFTEGFRKGFFDFLR